ncbi:hypothetical protein EB796_008249 [Bugula neritina]|uniref:C-type lectin domain-containing protein n=1 Tax=Bugula neritina TaxID=10212 RepID=A0A7J7K5G9_BUGNE|nr:hypothetical protein EB796_008249 [Bugula neritina]
MARRSNSCPSGWIAGPFTNCYKFVISQKVTWRAAQGLCRDMGGTLATLDSKNEIIWMRGYRSYHPSLWGAAWLGGYLKDGVWLWHGRIADSAITNTDWSPGEPNNQDGLEGCVEVYGGDVTLSAQFRWNDLNCNDLLGYICEKEISF